MAKFPDDLEIGINDKMYTLKYFGRVSAYDGAAFGFDIKDGDSRKGCLRVFISGTVLSIWSNHTKRPFSPYEDEQTVADAIGTILPTINMEVDQGRLKEIFSSDECLSIDITSFDQTNEPIRGKLCLKGHDSPESMVGSYVFGPEQSDKIVRNVILKVLSKWERFHYNEPITPEDLERRLFLPIGTIMRNLNYLRDRKFVQIEEERSPMVSVKGQVGTPLPPLPPLQKLYLLPDGVDLVEATDAEEIIHPETPAVRPLPDMQISDRLNKISPALGSSYSQIVADLQDVNRIAWRGTANEMREVLRELLESLAPDDEVSKQTWYKITPGTNGPTRKQRALYILRKRRASSREEDVIKEIEGFEDRLATFVATTYTRANQAAHTSIERKEVIKIYGYFEAFLRDLLDIGA